MSNAYQILSNPLLTSGGKASEDEIRARAAPILSRLSAFESFAPITATTVADWSMQAGDIVKIDTPEGAKSMPIFTQKISWNGGATSVYESTGSEKRPVQNIQVRKESATKARVGSLGRRMENTVTVDRLRAFLATADYANIPGITAQNVDVGMRLTLQGKKLSLRTTTVGGKTLAYVSWDSTDDDE